MIVLLFWLALTTAALAETLPLPEVTVEAEDLSRPTSPPTAKPPALPPNQDAPLPLPELGPREVPHWQFRTEPVLLQSADPPPAGPPSRLEAGLGLYNLFRLQDTREVLGLASRLTADLSGGPRWFRHGVSLEGVWTPSEEPESDRVSGATQLFQFGRGDTVFQGGRLQLGWHGLINTQVALAADSVAGQGGWGIQAQLDDQFPWADTHALRWKAWGQFRQETRTWWGGRVEVADRMTFETATLEAGLGFENLNEHLLPYPVVQFYWPFWPDTQLTVESLATLEAPFLTLYHERVTPLIQPLLQPEKGWGGSLRLDRRFSPTVTMGLGVQGQGVADWIYWQNASGLWQPANSQEWASRVGVTADVETRWSEAIRQTWGYRLRYGLIKNLRRGEHQLGTHLTWRWADLPLDGDLGLQMRTFDLESQRPLYLLLDGSISYHVTERIAVTLRAENWPLTALESDSGWWEPMSLLAAGVVARF